MTTLIDTAIRRGADRSVTLGILALRILPYQTRGAGPSEQPIKGLSIWPTAAGEAPIYHRTTGLYGFLELPPGPQRFNIVDPLQRYLPRAVEFDVPDRRAVAALLRDGRTPPDSARRPDYHDIGLRPSATGPLVSGETSVWGVVQDSQGRPRPFARVEVETLRNAAADTVVTYSDLDGLYLARLPFERPVPIPPEPSTDVDTDGDPAPLPAPSDADPAPVTQQQYDFPRRIRLHVLKSAEAAKLKSDDPLRAFPAAFDTLDLTAPASPYEAATFSVEGSEPAPGPDPAGNRQVKIHIGRRIRWDLRVT